MSTISSVTISSLAYKKLVLHTAKYPTARVLGLLLADTASSSTLSITDAIPLSHHWTSLAPMAEVALSLATSYASTKNLTVVGLYEAPEMVSDRSTSQQANKLAEKIASLAGREAVLLLVDNASILSTTQPLSAYTVVAGGKGEAKPKALPASAVSLQNAASSLESAVRKDAAWEKIVDFDA
uniref:MPN domain-containing protein n=1 Tax=Kalmanozyma brasiliensis (strain GHG001) TaxID=1365824 RepID=V5EP77_KALBG